MNNKKTIGYACAYTPLPLIDAAGFNTVRILPSGDFPDQAGRILHDNLCPHVKKILDRALSDDLPELFGMIFVNSCDAMRRLSDAWKVVRPGDKSIIIELPVIRDEDSIAFFSRQLEELSDILSQWGGGKAGDADILHSIEKYNKAAQLLSVIKEKAYANKLLGGFSAMQKIYNRVMSGNIDDTITYLEKEAESHEDKISNDGTPVYLFGNILPEEAAFSLLESCGARIITDDLCTGSRIARMVDLTGSDSIYVKLARGILNGPECARTFDAGSPGKVAHDIVKKAKESGAKGVIGHTVKFCDPYLQRIPYIREYLKKEGIPFLLLEGDCTLRSIEQHRTRIEAFIEMLS